jgi:hypothetical protein
VGIYKFTFVFEDSGSLKHESFYAEECSHAMEYLSEAYPGREIQVIYCKKEPIDYKINPTEPA